MKYNRWVALLAVALCTALVLAGCGGTADPVDRDDDDWDLDDGEIIDWEDDDWDEDDLLLDFDVIDDGFSDDLEDEVPDWYDTQVVNLELDDIVQRWNSAAAQADGVPFSLELAVEPQESAMESVIQQRMAADPDRMIRITQTDYDPEINANIIRSYSVQYRNSGETLEEQVETFRNILLHLYPDMREEMADYLTDYYIPEIREEEAEDEGLAQMAAEEGGWTLYFGWQQLGDFITLYQDFSLT